MKFLYVSRKNFFRRPESAFRCQNRYRDHKKKSESDNELAGNCCCFLISLCPAKKHRASRLSAGRDGGEFCASAVRCRARCICANHPAVPPWINPPDRLPGEIPGIQRKTVLPARGFKRRFFYRNFEALSFSPLPGRVMRVEVPWAARSLLSS